MRRDMELVRKILFKIEELHTDVALYDLEVDGYDMSAVAYHCKMLYEAGFISDYDSQFADGRIYTFGISGLTWQGQDFLDKIREDTVWNKTKTVIKDKGLPMVIDVIKDVSGAIVSSMVEGTIKGLKGGV